MENETTVLVFIKINPTEIHQEDQDLNRLASVGLKGLKFEIPKVKSMTFPYGKAPQLVERPLLLSYGFLRIPLQYARNQNKLSKIRKMSRIVVGYFYRDENELEMERDHMKAEQAEVSDDPKAYPQILVKTIKEAEVTKLYEVAKEIDIYDNEEELAHNSFIILQTYPFNGMAAQIVRSKLNGKIQVQLLESGIKVWIDSSSILYSKYTPEEDIPY